MTLVFMHVPKSAGIAVMQAVATGTGATSTLMGFDRTLFSGFNEFETIAPEQRQSIFLNGLPQVPDSTLVAGHFSLASLRSAYPHSKIFTIVREARIRILSHFLYWRSVSDDYLSNWGTWAHSVRIARRRLDEFLSDPTIACQTDNLLARLLLCPHEDIPSTDFIPAAKHDSVCEAARRKIDSLDFVAWLEGPTMKEDLERWLGTSLTLSTLNVTPPLPGMSLTAQLTAKALDHLDLLSSIDRALWCYVVDNSGFPHDPRMHSDTLFSSYLNYWGTGERSC